MLQRCAASLTRAPQIEWKASTPTQVNPRCTAPVALLTSVAAARAALWLAILPCGRAHQHRRPSALRADEHAWLGPRRRRRQCAPAYAHAAQAPRPRRQMSTSTSHTRPSPHWCARPELTRCNAFVTRGDQAAYDFSSVVCDTCGSQSVLVVDRCVRRLCTGLPAWSSHGYRPLPQLQAEAWSLRCGGVWLLLQREVREARRLRCACARETR
jgi:hypothetical protein